MLPPSDPSESGAGFLLVDPPKTPPEVENEDQADMPPDTETDEDSEQETVSDEVESSSDTQASEESEIEIQPPNNQDEPGSNEERNEGSSNIENEIDEQLEEEQLSPSSDTMSPPNNAVSEQVPPITESKGIEIPQLQSSESRVPNQTNNSRTRVDDQRVLSGASNVSRDDRSTSEILIVPVNKEFSVVIQNVGWIFVSSTGIAVELQRSVPQSDSTMFFFMASAVGASTLGFERYDLGAGTDYFHTANITIVPEKDDSASEDTSMNASILGADSTENGEAFSVETASLAELANFLEREDLKDYQSAEVFKRLHSEIENGRVEGVLPILRILLVRDKDNLDATYYHLGAAYETSSSFQDVESAVSFYRLVQTRFPLSEYYDKAHRRREFLERNFIQLR